MPDLIQQAIDAIRLARALEIIRGLRLELLEARREPPAGVALARLQRDVADLQRTNLRLHAQIREMYTLTDARLLERAQWRKNFAQQWSRRTPEGRARYNAQRRAARHAQKEQP